MLCLRNCKLSNLSCDGSAVECADAGASLTEAFNAVVPGYGSCTTTVRLDYTTYAILGFEYFCSDFGNVVSEEPEARTIAETDTGLGTGSLLAPYDSDVQLFVYYNESGEVGVVSGPIGHGVFGGTWGTTQAGGIT